MIGNFKTGFMPTGSYGRTSIEKTCSSLKSIGYDAVEWPVSAVCPRNHRSAELETILKTTHESGLAVSEVVVQQDYVMMDDEIRKKNIDYTVLCIEVLSSLGIKTLNLFTGPVPWMKNPVTVGREISQGRAWDMVFNAFDQIVPLAEKHQIHLAVENVWGMLCHDFYTTQFLVEKYDSPYLGVNYDPSHDILAGNFDVGWMVRQWGIKRIKHVHLKDAAGIQDQGRFVFPLIGEGCVDWTDFFSALRDIGYQGYSSVEFESFAYLKNILGNDMEAAARLSFDLLKKVIPA